MATITSAGSGLWSATATWVGGAVPIDNDTVVIAAGHTVEFNVDQSAFTGINGMTITGTLKLTRAAGNYCLKMKAGATFTGSGIFDGGTADDPIPYTTKHTITGGAGFILTGASGLTFLGYGVDPSVRYVNATSALAAGTTVLPIDTDVTGDKWAVGDDIYIAETTIAENDVERRVIQNISSNSITITAGLTNAKGTGATIVLLSRNLKFLANSSQPFLNFPNTRLTLGGIQVVLNSNTNMFRYSGAVITGGTFYSIAGGNIQADTSDPILADGSVFHGFNSGFYLIGHVFKNCIFSSNNISFGFGTMMQNCLLAGMGTPLCYGFSMENCTITGAVWGFRGTGSFLNCTIVNCQRHVAEFIGTLDNCEIGGNEVEYYSNYSPTAFTVSYNHNKVTGYTRFWTQGGKTITQTGTSPVGYSKAFQTTFESASKYGYWQEEVTVLSGRKVKITAYLRKSASMSYLPRCVIHNKALTDPFMGGTPIHAFTMSDSVNTWESEAYEYENTGSDPVELVIRCQGMNASGNLFSLVEIEDTTGGGGGGIPRSRLLGGI